MAGMHIQLVTLSALLLVSRAAATELSENDYFGELPTVLTVSRLAQPLNETPGAVTVIERETIRRSGARELADVLRLVPGYLVSGYNGANPTASYHAPLDDYGIRNLVLIDGRPVYSAYYLGGTADGMMGVLLEDVERIEVLRGSNSAAYGANALFGVINVITRHAQDTHGVEASVSAGDGAIRDNYARIGWGGPAASFRLSAGRRSDSGYANLYDDKNISQLHFRGDLRPAPDQELLLSAGVVDRSSGEGFADQPANPPRSRGWRNIHLLGQWRQQSGPGEELKLTASFNEETLRERFTYPYDNSVIVSGDGFGRRVNLELQQQTQLAKQLRAVWGAGYRYENAISRPLYNTDDPVALHEERLFGNLEWRPHPQWLINAGGFAAHHSRIGGYFSPRLMANYLIAPQHTLRFGMTSAVRTPTLFELASDVRFHPQDVASLLAANKRLEALLAWAHQPFLLYKASGGAQPERLKVIEFGYFGNLSELRLTLDLRAYLEKMEDLLAKDRRANVAWYVTPANPFGIPAGEAIPVQDFRNTPGLRSRGIEAQLRWKPFQTTEIWLNQSFQHLHWEEDGNRPFPPSRATTIAWFQQLPGAWDITVIYQSLGSHSWGAGSGPLPTQQRLDARLARQFAIGTTRLEAAIAIQAANGSLPVYAAGSAMQLERRLWGTLRLAF
ncbi:TonB-dependent receptor plug domain-containing protein [Sulfuricystis multivorans]|uniref:TonB-dependent receptor plug domain-containing protein n=1 Tax=Sulfuricystis multivorans TaxID=2211108 RepID=UPI001559CADD|nr:TonB-dependent receptor [Sulfuricystis multivorans]